MVSGYTGCTWAEGRAPRGRDPSADSEARIRRGRAQLVPRWTSNPGGNALNPRGLGAAPPNQQCSFPLIFRRARSGAIQGGHPFRPENAEAIQGPAPILHRHRPFFEAFRKAKYSSFMAASCPGGWTVRQVVHHVADSHMNAYVRFRLALTEDDPLIKPYNQAAWAELADARTGPVETS